MRPLADFSLKQKLMSIILASTSVLLLCFILSGAFFVHLYVSDIKEATERNLGVLAGSYGALCGDAVILGDPKLAEESLSTLSSHPNILAACFFTSDGKIFATYRRDRAFQDWPTAPLKAGAYFDKGHLDYFHQLAYEELKEHNKAGTLYLRSDRRQEISALRKSIAVVTISVLLSCLLGFLLSAKLQQWISRPIIELSATANIVSQEKNYSVRASGEGIDEVGQLIRGFNTMLEQIQQRDLQLQEHTDHLEEQVARRTLEIEREKKRSENLLRSLLPDDVAEELKSTNAFKPRRYENVGVLFCDIVRFSEYCDKHPPEDVVMHLQELIQLFENIAASHGLEKIKTVGDCFMATAGLSAPVDDPALRCVRCGLEMVLAAGKLPPQWQVHIGVHRGPVVGGVVGSKKYLFDIWGDAVNLAAHIQNHAAPDAVCVSGETWSQLARHCTASSQGFIHVKGKGELEIFKIECMRDLSK